MIKRYKRDAFPDEFNKRFNKAKLGKILKERAQDVGRICIRLNTYEEINDGEMYEAVLVILPNAIKSVPEKEYRSLKNLLEKIVEIFEQQQKIKILNHDVKSLEQITAAEYFSLKELDFDYLSFND